MGTYEPCVLGSDGNCTRWSHDHAADCPSVTDDARAEAERRWPEWENDEYQEGHVEGWMAHAEWAAGRAETTTATVEDAPAAAVEVIKPSLLEHLVDHDAEDEAWNIANSLAAAGLLARPLPDRDELARDAAANALTDFADGTRFPSDWILFRREDGSGVTVPDLLRETAANIRGGGRDR